MASRKRAPASPQSTPVPETPRSGRQTVDRSVSPDDGRQHRRRPEKSRTREEKNEEEARFNLGCPKNMRLQTPTGTQRRGRAGKDFTDFPPPVYEAASPVPMSIQLQNTSTLTLPLHHQMTDAPPSPYPLANVLHSQSPPPPSSRVQSETETDTESELANLELLDIEPSLRWEGDRKRGLNLNQRVAREFERQKQRVVLTESPATSPATSPQPSRHNSFNISRNTSRAGSRLSLQIGVDQRVGALGILESPTGSMSETLSRRQRMKSLSPPRLFQPQERTQPPHPSASMISLLRPANPLSKNPPSVISPISSRIGTKGIQANKLVPRKLFHIKSGAKHEDTESLHDWEVLEPENSDDEEAYDQQVVNTYSRNAHIMRQMSIRSTVAIPRLATVLCMNEDDGDGDPPITTPRQTPSSPFLSRNVRRMSPLVDVRSGVSPSSSAPTSPTFPSSLPSSTNASVTSPQFTHGPLTESPVSDNQSSPRGHGAGSPASIPAPTSSAREEILVSTHRTLEGQTPTPSVTYVDYDDVTPPITPVASPIPLVIQPGFPSSPRNPVTCSPLISLQNSIDKPLPPVRNMPGRITDTYSIAIPADSAPPYTPSTPTPTRGGHYPWRPLPNPPQTPRLSPLFSSPSPIDSDIFTSAPASPVTTQGRQVLVPEGLLIDLSDESDASRTFGRTPISLLV